jgi:cell shape-determining protein MreD
MKTWMLVPFLAALWIVESVIVRNVTLFSGAADVVWLGVIAWAVQPKTGVSLWGMALLAALIMETASAMPAGAYLAFYLITAFAVATLRGMLRQGRFLLYLASVFFGSLIGGIFFFALLWVFRGTTIAFDDALLQVVIPTVFLNLLWGLPVYFLTRDFARWAYPEEVEE